MYLFKAIVFVPVLCGLTMALPHPPMAAGGVMDAGSLKTRDPQDFAREWSILFDQHNIIESR
jgi:hypothetical protein